MKITSTSLWSSALNNLMNAQRVQAEATNQYSTQKVATDLKGFGRKRPCGGERISRRRQSGF